MLMLSLPFLLIVTQEALGCGFGVFLLFGCFLFFSFSFVKLNRFCELLFQSYVCNPILVLTNNTLPI